MGSALVNCERVSGTWLFTAASVIVCFVQCVCLAGCTNSNLIHLLSNGRAPI